MDDGRGHFVPPPEEVVKAVTTSPEKLKNFKHLFRVGEELEIKGSRFVVKNIGSSHMRLKLIPRRSGV